jgi:hypothetical protein
MGPDWRQECPKCSVTVRQTARGWDFDPSFGCVDLRGTQWGRTFEFQWCPTLAAAMPVDFLWPGVSHKEAVEEAMAAAAKPKNR